jgi:diguanylate cyclase (GGDEF)-like protein
LPQAQVSLRHLLSRSHLRLVLLAVFLAAAGMLASGAYIIRSYSASNVELAARTLAYTVEPAVLFADREAVSVAVASVGDTAEVGAIVVVDVAGRVLARWRDPSSSSNEFLGASFLPSLSAATHSEQILHNGAVIGTVKVQASATALVGYTVTGLVIALCCTGIAVVATQILARRLDEAVIGPLERVADITRDVRSERKFARRLPPSGILEIDHFSNDVNILLGELESWHDSVVNENVELIQRAEHDPLTGLGNRSRFARMFDDAIKSARSEKGQLALLFIDCNGFKEINDKFGHDVGDMVICVVAERLRNSTRARDRVYRLGGDEFSILLERIENPETLAGVVSRIEKNMAEPVNLALRTERRIGVSIGTAIFPEDGDTARELLRRADERMYLKKRERLDDQK